MNRAGAISAVIGGTAILAAVTVAGVAVVNAASATTPADQMRTVVSEQSLAPTVTPTSNPLPDVTNPADRKPESNAASTDTDVATDEESRDNGAVDQGDSSGSGESATDKTDHSDSAETPDNAPVVDGEQETDGGPSADDGQDDDHGSVDDGGHGGEGDDGDDD